MVGIIYMLSPRKNSALCKVELLCIQQQEQQEVLQKYTPETNLHQTLKWESQCAAYMHLGYFSHILVISVAFLLCTWHITNFNRCLQFKMWLSCLLQNDPNLTTIQIVSIFKIYCITYTTRMSLRWTNYGWSNPTFFTAYWCNLLFYHFRGNKSA